MAATAPEASPEDVVGTYSAVRSKATGTAVCKQSVHSDVQVQGNRSGSGGGVVSNTGVGKGRVCVCVWGGGGHTNSELGFGKNERAIWKMQTTMKI